MNFVILGGGGAELAILHRMDKAHRPIYAVSPKSGTVRTFDLNHLGNVEDGATYPHQDPPVYSMNELEAIQWAMVAHVIAEDWKERVDVLIATPEDNTTSAIKANNRREPTMVSLAALKCLRPRVAIFERFPRWAEMGIAEAFLAELESADYTVVEYHKAVDYTRFGLPQHRKRALIVAVRNDWASWADDFTQVFDDGSVFLTDAEEDTLARFPLTPIEAFVGDTLASSRVAVEYQDTMQAYESLVTSPPDGLDLSKWRRKYWDTLTRQDAWEDYMLLHGVFGAPDPFLLQVNQTHAKVLKLMHAHAAGIHVDAESASSFTDVRPMSKARLNITPPGAGINLLTTLKDRDLRLRKTLGSLYRRLHPLVPAGTVLASRGGGARGYHYRRDRYALQVPERARLQGIARWLFPSEKSAAHTSVANTTSPLVITHALGRVYRFVSSSGKNPPAPETHRETAG